MDNFEVYFKVEFEKMLLKDIKLQKRFCLLNRAKIMALPGGEKIYFESLLKINGLIKEIIFLKHVKLTQNNKMGAIS